MTTETAAPPIRIALLDFEPLRVAGLLEILSSRPHFRVVATDLTTACHSPEIDVVLVLARRRVESWMLLGRLRDRHPRASAIVMSPEAENETIMDAITAGARGWLLETASPEKILQAIEVVLSGSIWAPRRILSELLDRLLSGSGNGQLRVPVPRFTEREEAVLGQLVMARSNREIAEALSIREQTVKSYVARMMRKVGVDNRIALSLQAAEGGWWHKE